MQLRAAVTGIWTALLSQAAGAAEVAADKAPVRLTEFPLDGGSLANTAVGLLLVLALIVGLAWLLRRMGHLPVANKGLVRIIGGVSLGPRERAVLLSVGQTRLLVGVAPGRVQTLHVLAPGDVTGGDAQQSVNRFDQRLDAAIQERQS